MKTSLITLSVSLMLAACGGQIGQTEKKEQAGQNSAPTEAFKAEPVSKELHDKFLTALKSQIESNGVQVRGIYTTPAKGFYEIVMNGNQVAYITEDAKFVFAGSLLSVSPDKNLTAERMADLSRIPFDELPLEQALKTVYGKGTQKIAVFSDPDCPYCRQLEKLLSESKDLDLTVYTFMMPIDGLHPNASKHAKKILCSVNPEQAWKETMLGGSPELGSGECDNAKKVEEGLKLANKYGMQGTPTIIFENGFVQNGVITPEQIKSMATSGGQNSEPTAEQSEAAAKMMDDLVSEAASEADTGNSTAPAKNNKLD